MSLQSYAKKIAARQEHHKNKSLIVRIVFVVAGYVILLPGIPLLFIFPEAGIPLVFFGLVLLSYEYTWAGNVLFWFAKGIDKIVRWYRSLHRSIRYAVELFFILLTMYLIYLIVR